MKKQKGNGKKIVTTYCSWLMVIENCTWAEIILSLCVCEWLFFLYVCVHPVTEVLWGGAVRVLDTQYVADDVSKLSLWTATLSQQESVEIGERGRREEQQEQEGTLQGLFLWVTVLLVLSPLVPLIENQTGKKKSVAFYSCVSPISLSRSTPLFHSPSIPVFIENLFLWPLLVWCLMRKKWKSSLGS